MKKRKSQSDKVIEFVAENEKKKEVSTTKLQESIDKIADAMQSIATSVNLLANRK